MEKMNRNLQFDLVLETLTPLHIGSGETLTSVGEFIITNNKIRYLDLDAVNDFLSQNSLIENYTNQIMSTPQGFDTYKVLSGLGIPIENCILMEIGLHHNGLNPLNNNILHVAHHANGRSYIPGSSIKGMLKTVLLFHYLKTHPDYIQKIERKINEKFDYWSYKQLADWFKNFWEDTTKRDEIFIKKEFNLLRTIDSPYIDSSNLLVEQMKRQHLYGVDTDGLDWLAETIKPMVKVPFRIQILPEFSIKHNELNSPDLLYLCKLINDYSLKMIEFEIKLLLTSTYENSLHLIQTLNSLKEQINGSKNEFAIVRIGKGKTFYFQTIWSLLNEEVLKKLIQKRLKSDEFYEYFPKTRVLTANDEMPGWVKISKQATGKVDKAGHEIQPITTN